MKTHIRFHCLLLVSVICLLHSAPAFSQRRTSPSVAAAAQLKNHPPNNWLKHYLGDDRYKISGGIWKVVSTQTDKRYHRANCAHMLRSSPGTVIGFASASDATEAGYVPDPFCKPPQVQTKQEKDADLDFMNPYARETWRSRGTSSSRRYTTIGSPSMSVYSTGMDKREDEYNTFRRNAGGLARQPGR